MNIKHVKRIPYGITDFVQIRKENYYYIDKTRFLNDIESAGRFLFFIRPRRFGKTLFLAMMDVYYDILRKDRFEELFEGTAIAGNPTDERNKYLVLSFNFSMISSDSRYVENSFTKNVRGTVINFIQKYKKQLATNEKLDYFSKSIEEGGTASDILSDLVLLVKGAKQDMYIIIDEYDNFANTLLCTTGESAYIDITHGEGFYRTFFNVLKAGASGADAPIKRLFITGVSPITLDDVTSGFNMGKNISLNPLLNQMLGFTSEDVTEMIRHYNEQESFRHPDSLLMELMTNWYGNYRFSIDEDTTLFNSDMVLYFLDNYMNGKKLPNEMVDRNVRIDYGKLRHLIVIDKGKNVTPEINGNFSKLKQVIEEQETTTRLVPGFSLEELAVPENFKSLLFYFGLLTIKGRDRDKLRLCIPNETVKRLHYEYIKEAYKETGVFSLDLEKYGRLMSDMAYNGKWQPLFEYITDRMGESMSLRDLITGEKSIQAFLNVYLGLSDLYIIHAEKEMNKGFVDIAMEPFTARYEGMNYSYLLEIKYLKSRIKSNDPQIDALKIQAEDQLKNYALDKKYARTVAQTTLIKLVLIFSGHQLLYLGELQA